MKILGIETKYMIPNEDKTRTSAVDWWRVISPLNNLKKITNWQIDIQKGVINKKNPTQQEVDEAWLKLGEYDIVFSSYYHNPIAYSYMAVVSKRTGMKYVYDLDDGLFMVKPYNPVYETVVKEKYNYETILKDVYYLTTTNGRLKKELKKINEKGNIFVLPNFIDDEVYIPAKHIEDYVITIAYQGGTSHVGDLLFTEFHSALAYILGKYQGKVRFQIFGFLPTELDSLPYVEHIEGKVDFYDWIEIYKKYSPFWDIGVAPLEENDFNIYKSPIKVMEYGISQVPTIASPVGPYLSIIKDKKNGYFARTVKDWINCFEDLIENREKRLKMGETIKQEVLKNWTIKGKIHLWKEVFEKIYYDKR
jgi:glycosyltransferase involved in cell wall biosynthesis